jgi:DNA primase
MVLDEELLNEIRMYVLAKTGKHYLGRIKTTSNNIMVSCPYHKGGQEQKPSMGIKLHSDEYGPVGLCHCFSCSTVTDISSMVRYMLGDKYNEDEVEARFGLETTIARETIIQEQENLYVKFQQPDRSNYVKEDILRVYRQTYPAYLKSRGISRETAEVYDIGYDPYNDHITFPIRDIYKRTLGLGRRAIQEKKYVYPQNFVKPLYGVYELPFFIRHLYIVEGPFNLWSLYEYGKAGVALLGTGTQAQYKQLLEVKCNDYVLALDGDDAGRKGISKLGKFLQQNDKKVYVANVPDGQDINDMTPEQFKNMYIGTFNEWKSYYKY